MCTSASTLTSVPQEIETSDSLVATLSQLLLQNRYMLVTAESCTGGLLGATLTTLAGSSAWYERGFITYSNAAKIAHLHVDPTVLAHEGAVSPATALAMAHGALACIPSAHLALSTTGIAGPGGATPDKPVGTVCFGIALRDGDNIAAHAQTRIFSGDRETIRSAAVAFAMRAAIQTLSPACALA